MRELSAPLLGCVAGGGAGEASIGVAMTTRVATAITGLAGLAAGNGEATGLTGFATGKGEATGLTGITAG